jgi:sulfonate transport system substrate-binding protein
VAQEAPSPTAQAIVVRADSPLKSLGDLKGKKVGVAKGSGGHYLLPRRVDTLQAGLFQPVR